MGKSKAAKAQVPQCRYGAACTRKDCVYSHPPKAKAKAAAATPAPVEKSDKVCFAFVAGRCAFGRYCHDKHPDEASCRSIKERYQRIDCQWGRTCRTEGCLYRHPSDEVVGPVMPVEPAKPQPAVFAAGPTIAANQADGASRPRVSGRAEVVPIPRAIIQAADLRDATAGRIQEPLERFLAVNARNTGTQSAALLDLHLQTAQTFRPVLDEVLPERLRMFKEGGVWLVVGPGVSSSTGTGGSQLFQAVRDYLTRLRYEFSVGQDEAGQQVAFNIRGRRRRQDPVEGVRAVLLCGVPGSGKSVIAEALARRSCGRFVRVGEEDRRGVEQAWQSAVMEACAAAEEARDRGKSSWWWDHAFSAEKYALSLSLRGAALAHVSDCLSAGFSQTGTYQAVLAYQPSGLDMRLYLGRPHRISFRTHLMLEATSPQGGTETVEALLCTARAVDSSGRAISVYIAPAAPQWAARHLQVLNAVPLDKRILANSTLGSFKVLRATELGCRSDRSALALLMHKAGEQRGLPAAPSFDAACLIGPTKGPADWTDLADAALGSLNTLTVLEDNQGASESEWASLMGARCSKLGFLAPDVRVSKPCGVGEPRMDQWQRLRPSCLLHCAAEEADVAQILRGGAAALRRSGRVALPPQVEAAPLPTVVVLDRGNASRAERAHWAGLAGLPRNHVVALHLDAPEADCVARRAAQTPDKASDAIALVRSHMERFEAPHETEGFRAIVRLRGGAAAAQELVRRWTEDGPSTLNAADEGFAGRPQGADEAPTEEEAPPPPLPQLSQWIEECIEVEEQGGKKSVWGVSLGCPVDVPLEGFVGDQPHAPTCRPPFGGDLDSGRAWRDEPPALAREPPPFSPPPRPPVRDEDTAELDQQEQLAATLRCMGFDEEHADYAAQRAGGNLNVAVESVLRGAGSG